MHTLQYTQHQPYFSSKPLRPLRQGWEQVPRKAPNTFQERSYTLTMGLRSTVDSPPGRPNRSIIFGAALVY